MKTVDIYEKKIIKMFYLSVNKDIDRWTTSNGGVYMSPSYSNKTYFKVNTSKRILLLKNSNSYDEKTILRYGYFFLIFNIKFWYYKTKLKKHFKKKEQDHKDYQYIDFMKNSLSNVEPEFTQEVRKQKLKKIKKI